MDYYKSLKNYLNYLLVEKNYSKGTIREYEKDLTLLGEFIKSNENIENLKIENLTQQMITNFLAHLVTEKNNKSVTRNKRLYSIKAFTKYLIKNNYLKENPALKIESSKTKNRAEPVYLDDDEVKKLIAVVNEENSWYPMRDKAIILTFIYTGLRLSELVKLDLKNINHRKEEVKFVGKGNKERIIPLHPRVINLIDEYVYNERRSFKNNKDSNALFMSNRGKRITPSSIEKLVDKYMKLSKVEKYRKISPHKLRHTFATRIYKETKDLKVLKDLLGHENISTTQIYTHTDHEDRRNAVDKLPDY